MGEEGTDLADALILEPEIMFLSFSLWKFTTKVLETNIGSGICEHQGSLSSPSSSATHQVYRRGPSLTALYCLCCSRK